MASDKQNNLLDSAFFSNPGDHFDVQQNGHMVLSLVEQIARLTAVLEAAQTEEGRECIRRALDRLDWAHTFVVDSQAPRPRVAKVVKSEDSADKPAPLPVSERFPRGVRVEYSVLRLGRVTIFQGVVVDYATIHSCIWLVIKKDIDGSIAKLLPSRVSRLP